MKGFTETERRRSLGQQPGARSGRRPADEPRINRLSTTGQLVMVFLYSVYMGFRLFVLPKRHSGQLFSMPWKPWGAKGTVVSWANRPVGVQSCPATLCPAPPCTAPPRPARGMSASWIRQGSLIWEQSSVLVLADLRLTNPMTADNT